MMLLTIGLVGIQYVLGRRRISRSRQLGSRDILLSLDPVANTDCTDSLGALK